MNKQLTKLIGFFTICTGSIFLKLPLALADTGASAYVYDPPTNIRQVPNGDVICQIKQPKQIFLMARVFYQGRFDGWYLTDACSRPNQPGTVWGVIHQSQIKNIKQYSDLLLVDPIGFIQCLNDSSKVPENCVFEHQQER